MATKANVLPTAAQTPSARKDAVLIGHAPLADVAGILRLLADPTRLRVYTVLRQGEACVCELAGILGLAENLVSHHLGMLRRAGLVHDRRDPSDARWVYYELDRAALERIGAALTPFFDSATLGTRVPTCGPAASRAQWPDDAGATGCSDSTLC